MGQKIIPIRSKKREIEELRRKINGLRKEKILQHSIEERFLIEYFNMSKDEIPKGNFNFSTVGNQSYRATKVENDDEIQIKRYQALMNLHLNLNEDCVGDFNNLGDKFHKKLKNRDGFNSLCETIKGNTIIIKKMRVLQLVNRIAHGYENAFMKIVHFENSSLHNQKLDEKDEKVLIKNLRKLFLENEEEAQNARENLSSYLEHKEINAIEKDNVLRYCMEAQSWMFSEKCRYIIEIAKDLQNTFQGYNYGLNYDENNRRKIIFDVPGYGQFSLHFGDREKEIVNELIEKYGVKQFQGIVLNKKVNILADADKMLLKQYKKGLSTEDRYLRTILCQNSSKTPEEVEEEKWCKGCKNPENAKSIRKIFIEYGLNPNDFKSQLDLKNNGDVNLIREKLELLKSGKLGVSFEILKTCKEFLTVVMPQDIELIFKILELYSIKKTNENLSIAFRFSPEELQKRLDLSIEMGSYDVVQKDLNNIVNIEIQEKLENEISFGNIQLDNDSQKRIFKKLYAQIASCENGVVLNIGKYTYSVIKVKNQMKSIIKSMNLTAVTAEQAIEIILKSLLGNKNFTEKEMKFVREFVARSIGAESRKITEKIERSESVIATLNEKLNSLNAMEIAYKEEVRKQKAVYEMLSENMPNNKSKLATENSR